MADTAPNGDTSRKSDHEQQLREALRRNDDALARRSGGGGEGAAD